MSDLKRVYVVSAPSGAGKTTLNRMLVEKYPEVELSVSLTTRPMREGDVHGRDYYFVDPDQFQRHIDSGDMLEWANVHGNLYGTSKAQLRAIEGKGHYALLEIDVQGWEQARRKLRKSTSIFILPPSFNALAERLIGRGTDPREVQLTRMRNAYEEIRQARHYDFFIVNDSLEKAFEELEAIVIKKEKGRIDRKEGERNCQKLLQEFEERDWEKLLRHGN